MAGRRPISRFATGLALVATLLSGIPPSGAHILLGDRLDHPADYCSVSGTMPTGSSEPQPGGHDSQACAHCDGCTGSAAGHCASPPTQPPVAVTVPQDEAITNSGSTRLRTPYLIAAPARGPPLLA